MIEWWFGPYKMKKEALMGNDQDQYLMAQFEYEKLPDRIRNICRSFKDLADVVVKEMDQSAERNDVLKRLIQAKDAAVAQLTSDGK